MLILTPVHNFTFEGREGSSSDGPVVAETWVENVYQIEAKDLYDTKVFVDLGANIGAVSVYAASLNPEAKVIAVEPEPHNRELLEKNLERNGVTDQVEVFSVLVHAPDVPEDTWWKINDGHGNSKISQEGTLAEVISLSTLFDRAGVDQVDVLKVDIEGAEFAALQDVAALNRVKYLTLEFDGGRPEFGDLVTTLAHWGSLHILGSPERGGYIYGRRY
jgi:FkbM family methyltransferase